MRCHCLAVLQVCQLEAEQVTLVLDLEARYQVLASVTAEEQVPGGARVSGGETEETSM